MHNIQLAFVCVIVAAFQGGLKETGKQYLHGFGALFGSLLLGNLVGACWWRPSHRRSCIESLTDGFLHIIKLSIVYSWSSFHHRNDPKKTFICCCCSVLDLPSCSSESTMVRKYLMARFESFILLLFPCIALLVMFCIP